MNLLIDKRDQEHSVEENDMQDALLAGLNAHEQHDEIRENTFVPAAKRKSPLGIILAAMLVLAAAVVIVYFGFYKKSIQLPLLSKQNKSQQLNEEAPPASADQSGQISSSAGEASPQNAKLASCIVMAPKIMDELAKVVNDGASIETLFFDEGSFSAELKAADAVSVYQAIARSLGPDITLTSSEPNGGQNVLIAGTFVSQPAQGGATLSNVDVEVLLRDMAEEIRLQVISLTISNAAQGQTVFLRLSGTFDECQQYLKRLSQQNFSITVSKLLLMPGQNGKYAFILRFYL